MTTIYSDLATYASISTTAITEETFLNNISQLIAETMQSPKREVTINAMPLLAKLLPQVVDICCKLRGYKNDVIEQRTLYSGNHIPVGESVLASTGEASA